MKLFYRSLLSIILFSFYTAASAVPINIKFVNHCKPFLGIGGMTACVYKEGKFASIVCKGVAAGRVESVHIDMRPNPSSIYYVSNSWVKSSKSYLVPMFDKVIFGHVTITFKDINGACIPSTPYVYVF